MTPPAALAQGSLWESHEDRIKSLEDGQRDVAVQVAAHGANISACLDNVRRLTDKFDEFPEQIQSHVMTAIGPMQRMVERMAATHEVCSGVVTDLKLREEARIVTANTSLVKRNATRAAVISLIGVVVGACLKFAFDFYMKGHA